MDEPSAMRHTSEVERLAAAIEILFRESLSDSTHRSDESRQRILDQALARNRTMVEKKQVGQLRSGLKTMVRESRHFTAAHTRRRVFEHVLKETGLDLRDLVKDEGARVEAILSRGKIRTENEFRIIRAYLDDIEGTDALASLVHVVDAMLLRSDMKRPPETGG